MALTSAHLDEGIDALVEHAVRLARNKRQGGRVKARTRGKNTFFGYNAFHRALGRLQLRRREKPAPLPFFLGDGVESLTSTQKNKCNICLEDSFKFHQMPRWSTTCNHRLCRSCMKTYIESQVNDGKLHIECPHVDEEGRRCTAVLHTSTIARVCGEQVLATYNKNLYANHFGYVSQLQEDALAGKDTEFVTWAHDHTRNCPRCSVIIYRFAGCDHMRCRCGMSFNWSEAPKLDLPPTVKEERERRAAAAAAKEAAAQEAAAAREAAAPRPSQHVSSGCQSRECQSTSCSHYAFGTARYCQAHSHLEDPNWPHHRHFQGVTVS